MLSTKDLTKVYDENIKAVNNLNISIDKGEIYSLLGANGAGKTTTLNLLLNFLLPTEGDIFINEKSLNKDPLLAKKHLGFVSENVMLYGNFNAIQNLDYFSQFSGKTEYSREYYIDLLNKVGLPENAHTRRVKTYSKGMRQKCGIAIAIAKDADCILLDEPTSGLDPKSAKEFLNILLELKDGGKSILMTSHDIFRSKEVSDRIGIMNKGELVLELNAAQLKTSDLENAYLEIAKNQ